MNDNQKSTAICVAMFLALMMIFPPLQHSGSSCGGYDFILRVPNYCTINIPRLLLQWLCVVVVGGIVYWTEENDEENDEEK